MAARRPPRDRCVVVANVAIAFTLFVVCFVVACIGRDVAGGPPGSSGTGGSNGGAGGPAISCNPTGTGCLCILDDAQPGQLTTCSPSSVAQNDMEKGVCCVAQSLCTCTRYTCRSDPASSYCQCGSVAILATVTLGTAVADCPAPTAGQKCCFSQDNASCICSRLACAAEETEVADCSATAAGACTSGEAIAACR
jgi:hypothetical protein